MSPEPGKQFRLNDLVSHTPPDTSSVIKDLFCGNETQMRIDFLSPVSHAFSGLPQTHLSVTSIRKRQ